MKLSCPACGAEMTLDVLIANEAARDAVLAALQLPAPLGKLFIQYLAMFRPARRQLSWERVAAILGELQPAIADAAIERHGRTWPAPLEYWKASLEHMVQLRADSKLQLPLKSHGYLFEVIAGMSGKAEAGAEGAQERARRGATGSGHASHQAAQKTPLPPASPVPEAIRKSWVKPRAGEGGKGE